MAQIDPSIALGIKPIQIQDPLTVQSRAMEGAVNALKYQDLQRGMKEEEEVRNFLRGADLSNPETRAQLSQFGKTGLGYGKLLAEQEKAGLETKELRGKIDEKELKAFRQRTSDLAFNPSNENITAHIQDGILRKQITPEQGAATLQQTLNMNPAQRKEYFTLMGVEADKRLSDLTTRRGQDLTYSAATQPVFSEAAGGFVTRPDAKGNVKIIPIANPEETTKGKAVSDAKQGVTDLAANMAEGYQFLKEKKAIKSVEASGMSNLARSTQSGTVGQMVGSAFGTEEQDTRDFIKSQRPLLVQSIVKASGMSAQQINSNAELKNLLDAATDPGKGYESNVRALRELNKRYGTGNSIFKTEPPADNAPKANAPAGKPSLDDIFKPKKL